MTSLPMCSFDFVFCFLPSFQPAAPQIFAGLIFQPLFPGGILPTSQATPDVQNGILPAGQGGVKPAIQGTSESPLPTTSDTDDDFGGTTPAGIQRGMRTTEETITKSPNGKFFQQKKMPLGHESHLRSETRVLPCLALTNTDPDKIREPLCSFTVDSGNVREYFYWTTNPNVSTQKEDI